MKEVNLELERKVRWGVFYSLATNWLFGAIIAYLLFLLAVMVVGIFVPFVSSLVVRVENHQLHFQFWLWFSISFISFIFILFIAQNKSGKKEIQKRELEKWLATNSELRWRTTLAQASEPELKEAVEKYKTKLKKDREFLENALAYLEQD